MTLLITQILCPTCPQAMCCKVTYGRLSQIMAKAIYANGSQNGKISLHIFSVWQIA